MPMLFNDIIKLIATTSGKNSIGDAIKIPSEREVFANKKSIRQNEFYQATATGLRPEIMFEIRAIEYQGEQSLEHDTKKYNIIRTYKKGGELIELICQGLVNKGGS